MQPMHDLDSRPEDSFDALLAQLDTGRNGHLHWPHRGTLNWPRPALVVGVCK